MEETVKDTRVHLTLEQKARLRTFLDEHPNLPQFAVSDWILEHFHVRLGRSTVYRIQRAPEGLFTTGNLKQKKRRRVKFPAFERLLLQSYNARSALRMNISDYELLLQAAECRDACGISDDELRLSNGWLYRFKTRHQLTSVSSPSKTSNSTIDGGNNTSTGQQRRSPLPVTQQTVYQTPAKPESSTLSAQALTTAKAPGFLNWEPSCDFQHSHFMIVNGGVLVRMAGVYKISVRLEHTAPQNEETRPPSVFKIFCGDLVIGECKSPNRVYKAVATSVWARSDQPLDPQTVLRVKFTSPGYAFTESVLDIKWKGLPAAVNSDLIS